MIDAVAPHVRRASSRSSRSSRRSARTGSPRSRSLRVRALGGPARDRRRASAATSARRPARTPTRTSSPDRRRRPLADAMTVNTYLGRDSLEPFVAACRRGGGGHLLPASRRRTPAASTCRTSRSRTAARSGSRSRCWSPSSGEERRRRLRPVEHRRRRRRDLPAGGRRGPAAAAAGDPAAAGRRRAGRDARRRRPRVHERAGERARHRLAFGHLRVPGRRGRLAGGGRGRGRAVEARGLDSLRLVEHAGSWARRQRFPGGADGRRVLVRYAAPAPSCSWSRRLARRSQRGSLRRRADEGAARGQAGRGVVHRDPGEAGTAQALVCDPERRHAGRDRRKRFGTTVDSLLRLNPGVVPHGPRPRRTACASGSATLRGRETPAGAARGRAPAPRAGRVRGGAAGLGPCLPRRERSHRRGPRAAERPCTPADREHHEADDRARHARAREAGRRRHGQPQAAAVGESSIYLQKGDRLTVRELVEAALIQSANDAAVALAEHVGQGRRRRSWR